MVAERVVDLLEAVEVHQHDGGVLAAPGCGGHGLLRAVVEERAVGEIGEGVMERLVLAVDRLPVETARRAVHDGKEQRPEQSQPREQQDVEACRVPLDRGGDRLVRKIDLERAHRLLNLAEGDGDIDLEEPSQPGVARLARLGLVVDLGRGAPRERGDEPACLGGRDVAADERRGRRVDDLLVAVPDVEAGDGSSEHAVLELAVEPAQRFGRQPVGDVRGRELRLDGQAGGELRGPLGALEVPVTDDAGHAAR